MAYTTIDKPTDYFNTKLYTGTGSTHNVTGVGFQPDWVWIKKRELKNHQLYDSVRGATKALESDSDSTETTRTDELTSFDSDGFSLSTGSKTNESSGTYASWNWLGGGTASSNTDGSITSSVSANTTAGFSIVTYTGSGSNPATIGHGLNAVPQVMLLKKRTGSSALEWKVYHEELGNAKYLILDKQNAQASDTTIWNSTTPSSSVFTVGSSDTNNTDNYVVYCFAEKKGFSKFGSWTGADGVFLYTGFKPAFILGKNASNGSAYDWWIFDNKRDTFNDGANNLLLRPNGNDAEATFTFAKVDFLSNGFKIYGTDLTVNGSGDTMIYMAFAENPFVTSTGIPTTAR